MEEVNSKNDATTRTTSEAQTETSATAEREESASAAPRRTNNLSTNMNNNAKHGHSRALRILELHGQGYAQEEIAEMLGISQPTVSKELNRIIASIYDKPDAYALQAYSDQERSVAGLKAIGRQLWPIAKDDQLPPELRIKALSLLMQTYSKTMQGTKNRRDVRQWLREARREQNNTELAKKFGFGVSQVD
jgi:DNA-binding CsgD family transcriptional regulator